MAGNALVVDDRGLAPGGERLAALFDGEPHDAGTGEVVRRRHVVGADAAAGWCDPAVEALHRSVDVEVGATRARRRPGRRCSCIHATNPSWPWAWCAGSASKAADAPRGPAPGAIRSATSRQLGLDRQELLPAPGVGLLEIDGGAEELAGGECVAVPPDGILLRRPGAQRFGEEPAELPVCVLGHRGVRGSGQSPRAPERSADAARPVKNPARSARPAKVAHCSAHLSICRCAATWPRPAADSRLSRYPASASGSGGHPLGDRSPSPHRNPWA